MLLFINKLLKKITRQTLILKKVILVNRSTEDFKSTSFSASDDGKFVYEPIKRITSHKDILMMNN